MNRSTRALDTESIPAGQPRADTSTLKDQEWGGPSQPADDVKPAPYWEFTESAANRRVSHSVKLIYFAAAVLLTLATTEQFEAQSIVWVRPGCAQAELRSAVTPLPYQPRYRDTGGYKG